MAFDEKGHEGLDGIPDIHSGDLFEKHKEKVFGQKNKTSPSDEWKKLKKSIRETKMAWDGTLPEKRKQEIKTESDKYYHKQKAPQAHAVLPEKKSVRQPKVSPPSEKPKITSIDKPAGNTEIRFIEFLQRSLNNTHEQRED